MWKKSILTPLHKSESLTDPSNFRGVAVNSCMGKLFNKLLQARLENKCIKEGLINNSQGSGKRGSRTADQLMVIRFLIDKYVTLGGKKLYACFFDIRRAYDTVPRIQLFYSLLKNYHVGGNFLKILQEIYTQNEIYIKLSEGLCQPFYTTVGILQGESSSPLLFNLFINKIADIFDNTCDPVRIGNTDQNCLLWSDDLFVCSQSAEGLQCAIDKVQSFYTSIGLQPNTKKTKILIFNKAGRVLTNHCFMLAGVRLEITECYQYLGIKLRPSGSLTLAADELCSKARRSWFSISNLIYKDKRMSVDRAFQLFDSLVSSVALYGCEFWLPSVLPQKCFTSKTKLLSGWEGLKCETINQQCCRILLSVHKKTSRLAVLGELGRYPMAVKAMAQTLNYKLSLEKKPADSILGLAMAEMATMASQGIDCWLTRVNKMSSLLNIPLMRYTASSGRQILKSVKGCFDRYWLDQIKSSRIGADNEEHNKLLTYSSFKAYFGTEVYIKLVQNRNQRCDLTRLRVSAHRLGVETQRYKRPPVPRTQRYCAYCPPVTVTGGPAVRPVDDECHCLTSCVVSREDRHQLFKNIASSNSKFSQLSTENKFKYLVCPTTSSDCKFVSRFLQRHFIERGKIDTPD